jgi:hypothetical protein
LWTGEVRVSRAPWEGRGAALAGGGCESGDVSWEED